MPIEIRNSIVFVDNDLEMLASIAVLTLLVDVDKFTKEHREYIGINNVKKHTFA